ncbi:MAG TPA: DNA repair protein RecN [Bacteroidia bacterium]|nr:DNA repair protein RecN [Bacteroidia bacterium]
MLKELKVQNFALINFAELKFHNGLIVITGETGAGKSILLDALMLALGGKADTSALFDTSKKCIVEATFDISKLNLEEFFQNNDLDYYSETIIRREVSADGKSRAFVNDTPVNVSVLKSFSQYLIDIHSQHQNLIIHSAQFRYNFIDAFADCLSQRNQYTQLFKQFQKNKKELETLIHQQTNAKNETEYFQFLLNELNEANIQEGELQQIEQELQQLENAEQIIQQLSSSVNALRDADINAIQLINQSKNNLQSVAKYNPAYEELSQRLQSVLVELKDISTEAESLLSDVEINPSRMEVLNERLNIINKLLKKHNVKTDAELLNIQKDLEEKISTFENFDEIIHLKQKELNSLEKKLQQIAEEISQKRKSVKAKIENECVEILKELAMPNAQFVIDIQDKAELDEYGKDEVKFLFSANKGVLPTEVQKSASGGEIARLMLTIKSLMAKKIHLPTIIFDEIDTGVSGNVAGKMGDIMSKMSEYMQVIVITHLPQIAAKGKQHLVVSKEEQNNRTLSKITEIRDEERIMEIAKMLSSGKPGEAAIQNAKELLMIK